MPERVTSSNSCSGGGSIFIKIDAVVITSCGGAGSSSVIFIIPLILFLIRKITERAISSTRIRLNT